MQSADRQHGPSWGIRMRRRFEFSIFGAGSSAPNKWRRRRPPFVTCFLFVCLRVWVSPFVRLSVRRRRRCSKNETATKKNNSRRAPKRTGDQRTTCTRKRKENGRRRRPVRATRTTERHRRRHLGRFIELEDGVSRARSSQRIGRHRTVGGHRAQRTPCDMAPMASDWRMASVRALSNNRGPPKTAPPLAARGSVRPSPGRNGRCGVGCRPSVLGSLVRPPPRSSTFGWSKLTSLRPAVQSEPEERGSTRPRVQVARAGRVRTIENRKLGQTLTEYTFLVGF